MKILRIVCWMIFPLIVGTIQSCCNCGDGMITYVYSINDIVVSNLNNAGLQPVVATNDTIGKRAYGLQINCSTTKVACNKVTSPFFIQSSYAFSCRCSGPFESFAKDTLRSIQILTVNDFDATHLAGADVTTYFLEDGKRPISSSDFLSRMPQFNELSPQPIQLSCLLMHEPVLSSQCQFRVEVSLSDGKKYVLLTKPITLL